MSPGEVGSKLSELSAHGIAVALNTWADAIHDSGHYSRSIAAGLSDRAMSLLLNIVDGEIGNLAGDDDGTADE